MVTAKARTHGRRDQKEETIKNIISMRGMFDRHRVSKSSERDARQQPFTGGSKTKRRPSRLRTPPHPLSDEFNETSAAYHRTVIETHSERLESIFEQLSLQLEDDPTDDNDTASKLNTAQRDIAALQKPLAEDVLRVRFRDSSSGSSREEDVALGTTMARFEKKVAETQAELKDLWAQWDAIQDEIGKLGQELLMPLTAGRKDSMVDELDHLCKKIKGEVLIDSESGRNEVEREVKVEAEKQAKRQNQMKELLRMMS